MDSSKFLQCRELTCGFGATSKYVILSSNNHTGWKPIMIPVDKIAYMTSTRISCTRCGDLPVVLGEGVEDIDLIEIILVNDKVFHVNPEDFKKEVGESFFSFIIDKRVEGKK